MQRSLETVLSPKLFAEIENPEEKIVVVIDILRATSTICTILANGARAVIAVEDEDAARSYQHSHYLVGGERGGKTIEGFDFGDSPFEYRREIVQDREIVLTTTNDTKCIEICQHAAELIIASFLNLSMVSN